MSAIFLGNTNADNAADGTNLPVTRVVQDGSAIILFATCELVGGETFSTSDTQGNKYQLLGVRAGDATNNQVLAALVARNVVGASTTITCEFGGTRAFRGLCAVEIPGAETVGPVGPLEENAFFQSAPTTGANLVNSGLVYPEAARGIIVALSMNSSGASTPTAGTGFTSRDATVFSSIVNSTLETIQIASFAELRATFTAANNSQHLTLAVFLADRGSGRAKPAAGLV